MAETAEQRQRRLTVVNFLDVVIPRVTQIMEQRLLISHETPVAGGVRFGSLTETWQAREARLGTFVGDLRSIRASLAAGPAPDRWYGDVTARGASLEFRGYTNPLLDAVRFYTHYAERVGRVSVDMQRNEPCIETSSERQWAHDVRRPTGIYIDVPDPERNPDVFNRLSPTTLQRGGVFEVMRDGRGRFFYLYRGGRRYLLRAP